MKQNLPDAYSMLIIIFLDIILKSEVEFIEIRVQGGKVNIAKQD